ncbi:hypothetical protein HP550_09945 [Cellulomonas humilata]|uniref:Cardiolipin synthase N-terminal domain-containing protein n=2 Tax=Cellulomonas humilata TaxID=144055 RepID=A0A7Y6DY13_9CELL|nr:hypothetical protein [Cellulomonas humilata]
MHTRWRDLSRGERGVAIGLGAVQGALALLAWADLASRPAALVRGRKPVWAAVIAVNIVGPILYLRRGRTFPRIP